MAITKTTKVQRVEVYPLSDSSAEDTANAKHPTVMVVYEDTLDDTEDADLPIVATRVKHLHKFVEDGGAATDVTGEATLVQDICGGVWS